MGCCCPRPKKTKSSVCCLPLRLGAIIGCIILLVKGVDDIYGGRYDIIRRHLFSTIQIVFAVLTIVIAFIGLVAALARWKWGARVTAKGICCILVPILIDFILQWISWIMALIGWRLRDWEFRKVNRWKPSKREVWRIILLNLFVILVCVLAHKLRSAFASLAAVWEAGGSGFEYRTAEEVSRREEQRQLMNA